MKLKKALSVFLVIGSLLQLMAVCSAQRVWAHGDGHEVGVGDYAQDFELKNTQDQKVRYHDKSKGKVSVLLFIDPDAQAKVQDKEALTSKRALERARTNEEAAIFINRISGEFKQVKFVIISLEDKDKTDKFLKDKAIQVETLIEEAGRVGHQYGIAGTPSMIVVDKEKKIRTMYRGFTDKTGETVTRDLKALSAKEERK